LSVSKFVLSQINPLTVTGGDFLYKQNERTEMATAGGRIVIAGLVKKYGDKI